MKNLILFLLSITLLSSCVTRNRCNKLYPPEVYKKDSLSSISTQTNSIIIRDTIIHDTIKLKGDLITLHDTLPCPGLNYTKKEKKKARTIDTSKFVKKSDIETKYFGTNFGPTTFTAPGTINASWSGAQGTSTTTYTLFAPIRGTDAFDRIGRECEVFKINIRGAIDVAADVTAAQGVAPYVRLVLCVLVGAKGGQPLPANLMTDNGVFAMMDPDHFGEWKILKDIIVEVPSLATTSKALGTFNTEGITVPFQIVHKFKKPLKVKFTQNTAGDYGDIEVNNINLWAMASRTEYAPRLVYHSSISYKDS